MVVIVQPVLVLLERERCRGRRRGMIETVRHHQRRGARVRGRHGDRREPAQDVVVVRIVSGGGRGRGQLQRLRLRWHRKLQLRRVRSDQALDVERPLRHRFGGGDGGGGGTAADGCFDGGDAVPTAVVVVVPGVQRLWPAVQTVIVLRVVHHGRRRRAAGRRRA